MSAQTIEIKTVTGNKYYIIDGVMYDIHFPLHWAIDHIPGTGPVQCGNCECYGKINGVFVCYCANCSAYYYEGKRSEVILVADSETEETLWKALPYLNGVPKHKIGYIPDDKVASLDNCAPLDDCPPLVDCKHLEPTDNLIPYYRGNGFMTLQQAIERLGELKNSADFYENTDYSNSRKERLDYMNILEQIIYLEEQIAKNK